jgi:hypothetical protein
MIGRVYKITNSDESIVYVGSTTMPLSRRWSAHKKNFRRWIENKGSGCSIFPHFNEHGIEAFSIHLVSAHEIENQQQLREFEQLLIDKTPCVNAIRAYRSVDQRKECNREACQRYNLTHREERLSKARLFREDNEELIQERARQYYQESKEKLKEQSQQYYQDHKDCTMERHRQWRLQNRERQRVQTDCECGGKYTHAGRSIHFKTQKHQRWLDQNQ